MKHIGAPLCFLRLGVDADLFAVLADALEFYDAVDKSKKGVVGADTDVVAGMDLGSALSHKDIARKHELTVGSLRAETLGLGITTVFGRAHTFFMCKKLNTDSKQFSHLQNVDNYVFRIFLFDKPHFRQKGAENRLAYGVGTLYRKIYLRFFLIRFDLDLVSEGLEQIAREPYGLRDRRADDVFARLGPSRVSLRRETEKSAVLFKKRNRGHIRN